MDCLLVKLGGSVVTCYDGDVPIIDTRSAHAVAAQLQTAPLPLIIVHGSGTLAKGVLLANDIRSDSLSREQNTVVQDFARESQRLTSCLISVFEEAALRPVDINPASIPLECDAGNISLRDVGEIQRLLRIGFTPILHGGMYLDASGGYYACSGDKIMAALAKVLRPRAVLFLTDVNGVYHHSPPFSATDRPVGVVDHTFWQGMSRQYAVGHGEMYDKLEQALVSASFAERVCIANGRVSSNIQSFCAGNNVGTRVMPRDAFQAPDARGSEERPR